MDKNRLRFLVVDDEFVALSKLKLIFEEFGECITAQNGKAAYDIFQNEIESNRRLDVVTLDIHMPEIDGLRLLSMLDKLENQYYRKDPFYEFSKKIILTAQNDPANVMSAFRKQADAFFVKPIRRTEIITKLRELQII